MRNNKGITLVALIITIIILIILAGISINLVLGENGLFGRALQAREDYAKAEQDEQTAFNALLAEIDKIGQGGSSGTTPEEPVKEPTTTAEAVKQPQHTFNKNIPVHDEYGNPVVIPAGFHIVPNGTDDVEYKYSTNTGTPTVQDGIVIADEEGNQFVWIPVGDIKNREGGSTPIQLQRCTFNASTGVPENVTTEGTVISYGIDIDCIEETKEEHEVSGKGNTIATDINAFKTSATTNHGYYLARYEASYKDGIKPYSKPSTSFEDSYTPPTTLGQLWNNITQQNAATAAKAMYGENDNFTSDLVNSYAWDTAIVFIETYSNGNSNYANQKSRNSSLGNTGERKNDGDSDTTDKVCNIYDMSSNCEEWTTETCMFADDSFVFPCVSRGGSAFNTDYCTSAGGNSSATGSYYKTTFRPALYICSSAS